MLNRFLTGLFLLALSAEGYAVPACPEIERKVLPDGSVISLRLVGDEYLNYTETLDGYAVELSDDGWYYYRDSSGITAMKARDQGFRDKAETDWLASLPSARSLVKAGTPVVPMPVPSGVRPDSLFRGLVILVEYNDCPFSFQGMREVVDGMLNTRGYDGFISPLTGKKEDYTGSVADYFYDSSGGKFQPRFDVVGPVKVDYSRIYVNQTSNAREVFAAALAAVDPSVDFSEYDCDGDGKIDLLYFIVAGAGSNYSGNDQRLLWPHASVFSGITLDGVEASAMACSTEFYGRAADRTLDGIGVVCHEFSHVLGLPDLYDTDYAGSGGQSIHPNSWMVMAAGAYFNRSRTPCAYSAFERMYAGFISPDTIQAPGRYILPEIQGSKKSFVINTFRSGEYFLLENRGKTLWDLYLPGEGMLVYHVDMNDKGAWTYNQVNRDPAHNCLRLLRAADQSHGTTIVDSPSDPFPGQAGVTELDNTTDPSLLAWSGNPNPFTIHSIVREENGDISFVVADEGIESLFEDFENVVPDDNGDSCQGAFCRWQFDGASLAEGFGSAGGHSLSMGRGAFADALDAGEGITSVTFDMFNGNPVPAVVRVFYRTGDGAWRVLRTKNATENITLTSSDQPISATVTVGAPVGERGDIRFELLSGRVADGCRIDNIRILAARSSAVDASMSGPDAMEVVARHGCLEVSGLCDDLPVEVYTIGGARMAAAFPKDGRTVFGPSVSPGIYIVRHGYRAMKVNMTH